MKLTLELTHDQGTRLLEAVRMAGMDLQALLEDPVPESNEFLRSLSGETRSASLVSPAAQDATITLLQRWIAEDATEDPEEIRRGEEELTEFKRNMNLSRKAAGERLLFPEVE